MSISQLQGTPWHIEYVKKIDKNRSKLRCAYYNKETKNCLFKYGPCSSSTYCKYYTEDQRNLMIMRRKIEYDQEKIRKANEAWLHQQEEKKKNRIATKSKKTRTPASVRTNSIYNNFIGATILHKKLGAGKIVDVTNDVFLIKFEDIQLQLMFHELFEHQLSIKK